MANPKKRKTHSASAKGRSHLALKKVTLKKCPKCQQARRPHSACSNCGHYRDREVFSPNIKTGSKSAAKKAVSSDK